MYWWNVSQLASDFQEGRVEEKERFKYYLAESVVTTLGFQPFLYYGETFKVADVVFAAVMLSTTILGTVLCYRTNQSGDNTGFIGRMVCLGWPILIRVGVLFLGISLAFGGLLFIAIMVTGRDVLADQGLEIWSQVVGAGAVICIYWLLYKYVTLVAHAKGAESPD